MPFASFSACAPSNRLSRLSCQVQDFIRTVISFSACSHRPVVTAWALENTPGYMVVDLTMDNTVRYYPGADFLSKKGFDQVGAAVANNCEPRPLHFTNYFFIANFLEEDRVLGV